MAFSILSLSFLLFALLPFSLRFPAFKRLDGPASSLLYYSYSHGAGLGKKVLPLPRSVSSNRYQGVPLLKLYRGKAEMVQKKSAYHGQTLLSKASA